MKAKSYFDNYWVKMVRYGQGLIDHRTLKSGGFYIWFDELSRLSEWFLHDDGDGIIFWFDSQSILYKCYRDSCMCT